MATQGYDSASSRVREAITEAARLTGVSEELLVKIIGRESGFNPNAANSKSSARGLGQHLDKPSAHTPGKAGGRYGITSATSRFDPRASALMTGELVRENAGALKSKLGRDATAGELYAAHFLGAEGAAQMIQAAKRNPNAAAADLFADAAAANRSIFFDAKGGKRTMSAVLSDLMSTTQGDGSVRPLAPGALPNIYTAEPAAPKKGFWEGAWSNFKAAAESEQTQVMALQYLMQAGDERLAPDANFKLTPELVQAKTSELPEKYATWVAENAHSEAHMDFLVKKAQQDIQNEAQLADTGFWGNLGFRGAAALTDIPTWFLGAGAGKLAQGAKLGRIALAGRAGLIAAAEAGAVEAVKMGERPAYGLDDAALNIATAMAFGSGFGAVFGKSGKELDGLFQREAARTERDVLESSGHKLTPEGEAYYGSLGAPGPAEKAKPRTGASGGAAATPQLEAENALLKGRIDVIGGLKGSPIREVRELADKLDLDVVGDGGATVRADESAFEYMRRTHEAADALVSRQVNDAYEEFAKREGLSIGKRIGLRDKWDEEVGRQILNPDHTADPTIRKAADAYRPGYQHWLDRAKAEGAEWAKDVKPNDRYFPMVFDREKVRRFIAKYDEDGVVSVIRQALISASPKMEHEVAQKVAEKYLRVVRNTTEGLHGVRANALSGLDREGLVELLTQEGLDPETARIFVEANKPTKGSGPANFRRKTVMNDLTKFKPDGGGEAFSVRDLTDLNAERVWERYNRSMAGHVAMVRAGFQTQGQFMSHVAEITKGNMGGMNPHLTDTIAEKNQRALEYLGRSIYGIPHENLDRTSVKLASIFGNFNFATMMGQSGIAQLGDVPKVMLKTSMEAAFRTFRFKDVFRVLQRGGREADELARDLEVMTGVGTQGARGHIVQRFQDLDDFYPDSKSMTALDRAQKLSKTGANVTALVSGMTPVTDFLSRWAVRSHLQHLVDIAQGRKSVPQKVLNDMGLGPQELARFRELVKHMDLDGSGVVRSLNRDKLMKLDPTGVDKLGAYLSRQARQTILETSPGALPQFMGTTAGRLFGQFRSFSMASHAANTLHNLKMGPAYAAKSFLVTGAWSTAIYALHTYSKAPGRGDAREYLEKNLDPVNALVSGFLVRSADSGLLAPVLGTAWDFSLGAAGMDNPFNYGRTTGLKNGILGIPAVATAVNVTDAAREGIADALQGDKVVTRQDASRVTRLLPLNNTYLIANAMSAFASIFPEDEQQ